MNAYISETVRDRVGKLGDNIRECKSVIQFKLEFRHAHFHALNRTKNHMASAILKLEC